MQKKEPRSPQKKSLILFEVLELPWDVLHLYVQDHPSSNLARLLNQSARANVISEPDEQELRYWVTSATMYRGVSQSVHGLRFLNQKETLQHPPLWVTLAQQGLSVGVFGASYSHVWKDEVPEQTLFYVPEKFAPDNGAKPQRAIVIQRFLRTMAQLTDQGHGKISARVRGSIAVAHFLLSKARRLHMGVLIDLFRRWGFSLFQQHRTLLRARLVYSAFTRLHEKYRPDFSILTSGTIGTALHLSLASYLQAHERQSTGAETLLGQALDELDSEVGSLMAVAEREQSTLVLASGYGQSPTEEGVEAETMVPFWLLLKPERLLKWLALRRPAQVVPAMLPCATVWFASDEERDMAIGLLSCVRRMGDGEPLFYIEAATCSISLKAMPDDLSRDKRAVWFVGADGTRQRLPIESLGLVERQQPVLVGAHSPEGVLLAYRPGSSAVGWIPDVDVTAIAATLIQALGATPLPAMQPAHPALLQFLRGSSGKE